MIDSGLFTRFELEAGRDAEFEALLQAELPRVAAERATPAWFGVRFGRGQYGIFDVFANEASRAVHLAGPVGQSMLSEGGKMLAAPTHVERFDVIAWKLPPGVQGEAVTKGLLLTFEAKAGQEREVESFLRDAKSIVEEEPKTAAWFAIRLRDGKYGIFDVFHGNAGRFAHLAGRVPRELAAHALSLLGSVPDLELLDVTTAKLEAAPA